MKMFVGLLNIRGKDLPNSPVANCQTNFNKKKKIFLFWKYKKKLKNIKKKLLDRKIFFLKKKINFFKF